MKTPIDNLLVNPKTAITHRLRVSSAAALLVVASTALCQAHNVSVIAQNAVTGTDIYWAGVNAVADSDCGKQIVGTAQIIEVPDPTTPGVLDTYEFLFWNINATPYTTTEVNFQPICGAPNRAIAVYYPVGGGCPPTPVAGCPPTTDSVLAYSLNDEKIIPTTPISSATGGWTAGSTVVTPPTTIQALPQILGYGDFKDWFVIGGSTLDPSSSLSLTGPGNIVLALYGIPDPDPCATLRNNYAAEIEACYGDGLSPKACAALAKGLAAQVEACESKYGESPVL